MNNILVNLLIIVLVSGVTGVLYKKVNDAKAEMENNSGSAPLETGIFTIEYGKGIKIIAIVCFAFFTGILILLGGDYCLDFSIVENNSLGVVVCSILFVLLGIYMVLGTCVWKVSVNKYEIKYRNYFGIIKKYDFRMVEVHKTGKGTIKIFVDGVKKIRIDDNLEGGIYFLYWAKKYKVYHE